MDLIAPIEASEWLAPIVVAKKPSGEIRLCIDLRALNKAVIVDHHPIPNISELISLVGGAKVYSSLDLVSAYLQICLQNRCQEFTAFITPFGTFKFKRMPFGLVSASSVFQRVMEKLLKGIDGVYCYQDDVLVCGTSWDEHNRRLRFGFIPNEGVWFNT